MESREITDDSNHRLQGSKPGHVFEVADLVGRAAVGSRVLVGSRRAAAVDGAAAPCVASGPALLDPCPSGRLAASDPAPLGWLGGVMRAFGRPLVVRFS